MKRLAPALFPEISGSDLLDAEPSKRDPTPRARAGLQLGLDSGGLGVMGRELDPELAHHFRGRALPM